MTKRKKAPVEAFDKAGPQNLGEGQTWCEECQAAYEGPTCPGCGDPFAAGQPRQGITRETRDAIIDEVVLKGFLLEDWQGDVPLDEFTEEAGQELLKKLQEVPEPGAETDPSTLAEVAEQASIETTTITEILPVPITDAEYKEIGLKMGAANQEIIQAENELKSVKSQYKSRIDSAKTRRDEYASIINAGHQQRQTECHLVKNFIENTITLIRLDTGEVVRTRTMTAAEKQRSMDFEE